MTKLERTFSRTLLCALILAAPTPLLGDEVLMKNGDRLSGTIEKMDEGKLILKVPYSKDKIALQWKEIQRISSEKNLRLQLQNGTENGKVITANEWTREEEGAPTVYRINPGEWQTGEGYLLTGKVNVNMDLQRGKTESDKVDLDGEIVWRRLRHRVKVGGDFHYNLADSNNKTTDNWTVSATYDYLYSQKNYVGAQTRLEQDLILGLSHRFLFGPYLGRNLIETNATKLSGTLGINYQNVKYATGVGDGNELAGSWSLDFLQNLTDAGSDGLQVYHRQDGSCNVKNISGLAWNTKTGLKYPLQGGFSLSPEVKTKYEGNTLTGTDPWQIWYYLSLGYAW